MCMHAKSLKIWPFVFIDWCWRSLVCFDSPIPDASTQLGARACPAAVEKKWYEKLYYAWRTFLFKVAMYICVELLGEERAQGVEKPTPRPVNDLVKKKPPHSLSRED